MRVFLDTNVLASALGSRGLCADLFRLVVAKHELVTSARVLDELAPILRQKFGVPEPLVQEILTFLRAYQVEGTSQPPPAVEVRDADDVAILAGAMESNSDVLVTGDKDLLSLQGRVPILITNPRGFWELLKQGKSPD